MIWPTKKEYDIAIENWKTTLSDPDLLNSQLTRNKHGKILALGGANHYVSLYKFDNQDGKHSWVVRCFCTKRNEQNPAQIIDQPPDDIENHYKVLLDFCRSDTGKKISALVPFDYRENEITVNGQKYPIIKMNFISVLNLGEFIAENYKDNVVMQQLAEAWKRMIGELEDAQIAHGDLDLTNVLVEQKRWGLRLRLIDYDSLWVPALGNAKSPVYGHKAFQHPGFFRKKERPKHEDMDRFSALVIYLSIVILESHPELYFKCGANEVDRLLFSPEDYEQPNGGCIMEFYNLNIPGTQQYIDELRISLGITNKMPRSLSTLEKVELPPNARYALRPPMIEWNKLKQNPQMASPLANSSPPAPFPRVTPLPLPINSHPVPSLKPTHVGRSLASKVLIGFLIIVIVTAVLAALGIGIFFLLKNFGVITIGSSIHIFSRVGHPFAASVISFSSNSSNPMDDNSLKELIALWTEYFNAIAPISCIISLILYMLVKWRIRYLEHVRPLSTSSSEQRSDLLRPVAQTSQQNALTVVVSPFNEDSQLAELFPTTDSDITQPLQPISQTERITLSVNDQSPASIKENEIEPRIKQACSQLEQGKSTILVELAIEIQLSYYDSWARLMEMIAETSAKYVTSDTKVLASRSLKDGIKAKGSRDIEKARICNTKALVLYRWILNSISEDTIAANIWCDMGLAYYHLPMSTSQVKTANLQAAITCYQIALYRGQKIIEMRIRINRYLGNAYMDMPEGDQISNQEATIACYKIAQLYSRRGSLEWVETNNLLGKTYYTFANRLLPKNGKEKKLEHALFYYKNALHGCRRGSKEWADIQFNQGDVYILLNKLDDAVARYNKALEVYTEYSFSKEYAETSYQKGLACFSLFEKNKQQKYFNEAEACYNNALRSYRKLNLIDKVKDTLNSIQELQKKI